MKRGLWLIATIIFLPLTPLPPSPVETVGSVYVVSANAPEPCARGVDPAELLCVVALRCRDAVLSFDARGEPVRAQLGLHVGPIVGEFSREGIERAGLSWRACLQDWGHFAPLGKRARFAPPDRCPIVLRSFLIQAASSARACPTFAFSGTP